jgi:hypothetical protein
MSKTTFKKLNLKKLREKFDYEKFYNYLTNKIKAANGKLYCPHGVITNLEENLGIDYKDIYEYNLCTPQCVLDKNYPSLSFEDGSILTFFNKNIKCEILLAAIAKRGVSYYFLFSFKDKDKKVLTYMYNHTDYGWDMDVEEIFDKQIKMSDISKKVLNKITKADCVNYQFMFFSKSLKVDIKKFVKTFEKYLKPIESKYPLSPHLFDMYIYEIDPKIKIPFLSNIDPFSVPDLFYTNDKEKNIIKLKDFKKGKMKMVKLLGKKVEIKSTKKYKVKPLFVHRYLKDDWKKIKGKLTGSIFFR